VNHTTIIFNCITLICIKRVIFVILLKWVDTALLNNFR